MLLLAHALFHLMGYDHMEEDEKKEMRKMEEKALNMAGIGRDTETSITDGELLELARRALEYSYSPYSHYAVGAALLCADGRVFTGCNIENSSFGLTNCAERTALFQGGQRGCAGVHRHRHCVQRQYALSLRRLPSGFERICGRSCGF